MILLIIINPQNRFYTKVCKIYVLGCFDSRSSGTGGDLRGYCLMFLVLVPLALGIFPMTDQCAHLTKSFAARFARERFVLHVYVSVKRQTIL